MASPGPPADGETLQDRIARVFASDPAGARAVSDLLVDGDCAGNDVVRYVVWVDFLRGVRDDEVREHGGHRGMIFPGFTVSIRADRSAAFLREYIARAEADVERRQNALPFGVAYDPQVYDREIDEQYIFALWDRERLGSSGTTADSLPPVPADPYPPGTIDRELLRAYRNFELAPPSPARQSDAQLWEARNRLERARLELSRIEKVRETSQAVVHEHPWLHVCGRPAASAADDRLIAGDAAARRFSLEEARSIFTDWIRHGILQLGHPEFMWHRTPVVPVAGYFLPGFFGHPPGTRRTDGPRGGFYFDADKISFLAIFTHIEASVCYHANYMLHPCMQGRGRFAMLNDPPEMYTPPESPGGDFRCGHCGRHSRPYAPVSKRNKLRGPHRTCVCGRNVCADCVATCPLDAGSRDGDVSRCGHADADCCSPRCGRCARAVCLAHARCRVCDGGVCTRCDPPMVRCPAPGCPTRVCAGGSHLLTCDGCGAESCGLDAPDASAACRSAERCRDCPHGRYLCSSCSAKDPGRAGREGGFKCGRCFVRCEVERAALRMSSSAAPEHTWSVADHELDASLTKMCADSAELDRQTQELLQLLASGGATGAPVS